MPTLYRIGCLRDDVIFFIYLYQKWIYPVDKTRANEYGITGEQLEQANAAAKRIGGELEPPKEIAANGMQSGDNKEETEEQAGDDTEGKKDK